MKNITVRTLFCLILLIAFAGTALAQSAPSPVGTWKGTFDGADSGTLTITIDSRRKVTVTGYSNQYREHFKAIGSLIEYGYVSAGNEYWSFTATADSSGSTSAGDFIWVFMPDFPGVTYGSSNITGTWASGWGSSTLEETGDFTVNFVALSRLLWKSVI